MEIEMEGRLLYNCTIHIDTNLINAKQKLPEINQLEKWFKDDVILINMSSISRKEALSGNNALRTRKANEYIFTITEPCSSSDDDFKQIEKALFPDGAQNENQRNDIRIICEAIKYQAILVTSDGASKNQPGGILGNRDKLKDFVKILSPSEAVIFIKEKIENRDEINRKIANEFGKELPPWTGKD